MAYSKTTWATGDVITAAKLNNIEDGVAANDTAIGGMAPLSCEGTLGEDGDNNATITLDKKAGEIYAAVAAGRSVKVSAEISEGITAENIFPLAASKLDGAGTVTYDFRIVTSDGTAYSVGSLSADDTVVLTKES